MKDKYISPEFELTIFDMEDVLATSGIKAYDYEEDEEYFAVFSKDKF